MGSRTEYVMESDNRPANIGRLRNRIYDQAAGREYHFTKTLPDGNGIPGAANCVADDRFG